jgi:hypothetical protein
MLPLHPRASSRPFRTILDVFVGGNAARQSHIELHQLLIGRRKIGFGNSGVEGDPKMVATW